jgi:hypothetical protein
VSGGGRAAGIPGGGAYHALHVLEDGLDSPEAAASDNRGLWAGAWGEAGVHGGVWEGGAAVGGSGAVPEDRSENG